MQCSVVASEKYYPGNRLTVTPPEAYTSSGLIRSHSPGSKNEVTQILLKDKKGNVRAKLYVDDSGEARLEFLNQRGCNCCFPETIMIRTGALNGKSSYSFVCVVANLSTKRF
ncbi:MAG: hypothetical protein JNK91_01490 [Ferruginibacter sp.]|nr:hypothetical protein [Ferruginibacter sp.]